MTNFIFPDVSFWQDDPTTPKGIDFGKMRSQTSAVNIRAGQATWQDREFKTSWANAKQAGLNRGSYWYYDNRVEPKRQAETWINALSNDVGELPLWCDFEHREVGNYYSYRYWYDFMQYTRDLLKGKNSLGIYTGYYYWLENTGNMPQSFSDYFGEFPLWVAWYNKTEPLIPKPFKDWTIWQFSDDANGAPYGVESKEIDLNYFNGTEAEFNKFFGVGDKPAPNGKIEARFGNNIVEYKEV